MTLADIKKLIAEDIEKNNNYIIKQLHSDVVLINQISQYIINSGGKRLRPLLVMLVAKALCYQGGEHINAAAIIEFIHTATLLHDDVVDDSELRRGKKTANNVFGNSVSVLTGDFLYSRAFQIMTELNSMAIMKVLADATNIISEGEVLQLLNCNNPNINEKEYMHVIYCKTAKLFEAACRIPAILNNENSEIEKTLLQYGIHLGNAFQLADDIMDYTCDAETMGKNLGDDLKEGKTTLPLIYALQVAKTEDKKFINHSIINGSSNNISDIIQIIKKSGAIDYCQNKAKQQADLAIESLALIPASPYKSALLALPNLAINRKN